MEFFRKIKRIWRMQNNQCPYCGLPVTSAFLMDGEGWRAASLCPELHHGFLYNYVLDENAKEGVRMHFRELDGGGQPMAIPEQLIKWEAEWKADAVK